MKYILKNKFSVYFLACVCPSQWKCTGKDNDYVFQYNQGDKIFRRLTFYLNNKSVLKLKKESYL